MKKKSIFERFEAFHLSHKEIYKAFEACAEEKWKEGIRHYGSKAICEELRYFLPVDYSDRDIKIENDFTSMYARLYLYKHPNRKGFFQTKTLGVKRAATLPSIENFVAASSDADLLTVCKWVKDEVALRGL